MSMSFDKYDRLTADEPASEVEPDLHTVGYINLRINASVLRKLEKKKGTRLYTAERKKRKRGGGGEGGEKKEGKEETKDS